MKRFYYVFFSLCFLIIATPVLYFTLEIDTIADSIQLTLTLFIVIHMLFGLDRFIKDE